MGKIQLEDIPFTYLVSWAKYNQGKDKGLTFLSTLSKRPESVNYGCWGDVLKQINQSKSLEKLKFGLEANKDSIIANYEEDSKVVVMPENASGYGSFYERVKAFVKEYAIELERPDNQSESRYDSKKSCAYIMRELFVYSERFNNPVNRGVIATSLGIKRQRVDQRYQEIAADCQKCLLGGQVGRVKADPVLVEEFNDLKQHVGTMISKDSFLHYAGIESQDGKTLEFLSSMLEMRVMARAEQPIPVIASMGLLNDYTKQIGSIIAYFRKEVFGIRKDSELKAELAKIEDTDLRDAMVSFINNSDEFVKYKYEQFDAVALDWKHLLTLPARLSWILHEQNAIDYQSAIHESELVRLYNAYAKRNGEKSITAQQLPAIAQIRSSGCMKLMSLGNTGYWKIRRFKEETFDLDEIIRSYLKKSDASFKGFLTYLETIGLRRLYPSERSLRSRYTANGGVTERRVAKRDKVRRSTAEERAAVIEYTLNYLNETGAVCTLSELVKVVREKYPELNRSTFSQWIAESDKVNIIKGTGRRPTHISARSVQIVLPRTVTDEIVDKALEIVWESPEHRISSRELYPQLSILLPDSCSKVAKISKALRSENGVKFVFTGSRGHSVIGLTSATLAEMEHKHRLNQSSSVSGEKEKELRSILSLNVEALKECLIKEFSKDLSGYGIEAEKVVDDLLYIYGMGSSITDRFSYYDILTYLPLHYAGNLDDDRERTLMKDCLGLVELFCKEFYQLKHDEDVVACIQDSWGKSSSVGLRTIISYFEQEHGYIPYKQEYTDFADRNMTRIVKDVINARNRNFAHQEQEQDLSKFGQEKIIHDSFLVMLYIASKYHEE